MEENMPAKLLSRRELLYPIVLRKTFPSRRLLMSLHIRANAFSAPSLGSLIGKRKPIP
jgi:hypothetical protein